MPLIRALLNNLFWILLLLIVLALYHFYSGEKPQNPQTTVPEKIKSSITPDASQLAQPENAETPLAAEHEMPKQNALSTPVLGEERANMGRPPEPETKTSNDRSSVLETQPPEPPIFPADEEMEQVLQSESPPPRMSGETTPSPFTPPPQANISAAQHLLQQARAAVERNDLQNAQNLYMQLLQIHPSANLLGEIANQLYRLGYHDMAEFAWVEAFNFLLYEQRAQEAKRLSEQLRLIAPQAYRMIIQQYPQFSDTTQPTAPQAPDYRYGQPPYNSYSPQ